MKNSKLTLYIGEGCPYCQRVIHYLNEHPMEIEIKDVWEDPKAQEEMITLTSRTQVPCLKMDDEYMHESLDIIEKLKELKQ